MSMDVNTFVREYKAKQQKHVGTIENIQYLSVKEYAERTHRSPVTVRQMCASGRIEGAIKNGKSWLIPMEEPSDVAEIREENVRLTRENARLQGIIKSIMAVAATGNLAEGGGISGL